MIVSFDSNILIKNLWMESTEFKNFIKVLDQFSCKVILSRVVLHEVVQHYRERVESYVEKISGTEAKLLKIDSPQVEVDHQVEKYQQFLINELAGLNKEHTRFVDADYDIYHRATMRTIYKTPPASIKGKGYKDALIWECLKVGWYSYYRHDVPIYFITNDTDFPNSLLKEIQDLLGPDVKFKKFSSLSEFNKEIAAKVVDIHLKETSITKEVIQQILSKPDVINTFLVDYFLELTGKTNLFFSVVNISTIEGYQLFLDPYIRFEIKGSLAIYDGAVAYHFPFIMFLDEDSDKQLVVSEFYRDE